MVACKRTTSDFIEVIATEINEERGTPIELARLDAATRIMRWVNREMDGQETELIPRYKEFCEQGE